MSSSGKLGFLANFDVLFHCSFSGPKAPMAAAASPRRTSMVEVASSISGSSSECSSHVALMFSCPTMRSHTTSQSGRR